MDIEFIRKICKKLPKVTEDVKWEHDLCFSIGGKMFCVASLDPPFGCSFKVKEEEFEELSNRSGFSPAPYMARAKWVKVAEPDSMSQKEWSERIRQSYDLVKSKLTKKLREELGI
jgi:predicted DNA-binding protein (MmcQ/YjbR family)